MKRIKAILFAIGIVCLTSNTTTSMRRITPKLTAPVGQAVSRQIKPIATAALTNQARQFATTQPNYVPSNTGDQTFKRHTNFNPNSKQLDPKLLEINKQVTAWQETLSPEQKEAFALLLKDYNDWFGYYLNNPTGSALEYTTQNSADLKRLMHNLPIIWKQYTEIQHNHTTIEKWRKTLTPEEKMLFKREFENYDDCFKFYSQNPTNDEYLAYLKKSSDLLTTGFQQYQKTQHAHAQIMSWRATLTEQQQELFTDTFHKYDELFQEYSQAPIRQFTARSLEEISTSILNIIHSCSKTDINPLVLYSDFLTWKQQQSPETLQKLHAEIDQLTQKFHELSSDPNTSITDIIGSYTDLYRRIGTKIIDAQPIPTDQYKALTSFNQKFTTWKAEQSPETLKLLEPWIQKYEDEYQVLNLKYSASSTMLGRIKKIFHPEPYVSTYKFDKIKDFFYLIIHSDLSSLKILPVIKYMQQQHHQISTVVAKLSPTQKKLLEQKLKEYEDDYNRLLEDPTGYSTGSILDSQSRLIMLLQKNIQIFEPILGYDTKLQSKALESFGTDRYDDAENFHTTIAELKPEAIALQHIARTHNPTSPFIPLSSSKKTINALGSHSGHTNLMQVGQEFHALAPARQYHTLIHESRHGMQNEANAFNDQNAARKLYPPQVLARAQKHTENITWESNRDQSLWKPYEHDADHFATSHIACPICLKIVQSHHGTTENPEGYFNQADIEPFIQAAKNNPCCPAHSMTPGDEAHNRVVTKLNAALEKYKINPTYSLAEEISNLDKKSGTLLQHIPGYHTELIRAIAQHKEFLHEKLPPKLRKEIDIHQQMEQTAREIREGKYKMLEAPKPLIPTMHTDMR